MSAGGFFRGTSSEQDARFANKNKKLRRTLKFPSHFDKKVHMSKVKGEVMKMWVREKITELLSFEDDVLIGLVENLLEEETPDPREMQIQLTGFLEKKTPEFMSELWQLLLSAQSNSSGIPQEIIDNKKASLAAKREDDKASRMAISLQHQHPAATTIRAAGTANETFTAGKGTNAFRMSGCLANSDIEVHAPGSVPRRRKRKSKWDSDKPVSRKGQLSRHQQGGMQLPKLGEPHVPGLAQMDNRPVWVTQGILLKNVEAPATTNSVVTDKADGHRELLINPDD